MRHILILIGMLLLAAPGFALEGVEADWRSIAEVNYDLPRAVVYHPQVDQFVVSVGNRLVRLSTDGEVLGQRGLMNGGLQVSDMLAVPGGVLLSGSRNGEAYIAKYGPDGTVQRQATFDEGWSTESITRMIPFDNGELALIHYAPSSDTGHRILRMNPAGQILWTHSVDGHPYDAVGLDDGSLVFVGYAGGGDEPIDVTCLDADGNVTWDVDLMDYNHVSDPAIGLYPDGTLLVMHKADDGNGSYSEPGPITARYGLDGDGNQLWAFDDLAVNHRINAIHPMSNGNMMACGGLQEGWMLEIDPNGDLVRYFRDYEPNDAFGRQYTDFAVSPAGQAVAVGNTHGTNTYFVSVSIDSPEDPFFTAFLNREPAQNGNVVLPAGGGEITFDLEFQHYAAEAEYDIWVTLFFQYGGTMETQVIEDVVVPQGTTLVPISQTIGPGAPSGDYLLEVKIGEYPDNPVERRAFFFWNNDNPFD